MRKKIRDAKTRSVSGNKIDWDVFIDKVVHLIKFVSSVSVTPINADRWEEVVFNVLKNMGQKYKEQDPKWDIGSHLPGADIWTDDISISAKSGKITKDNLIISSYRLTRFKKLNEMIDFIDGVGKNFDVYLCCARIDTKNERVYRIFCIPANIFSAKKLSWKGFEGYNKEGVRVKIVKKMSNQLWINIPISSCKELGRVAIPKNYLGSKLSEIAQVFN